MGWNEGSFIEGTIAGAISGAGVGLATGPASPVGVPTFAVIGAIIGGVLKSPIAMLIIAGFVLLFTAGGTSFLTGIPLWIILIGIFLIFVIFRRRK